MGVDFVCEKRPAMGSRGMVVTNHPLASAAAAECLLAGGNAIDAAVTALFALSVVEPMMVGPLGGGLAHIRLADGSHRVIDALGTAPRKARPDMYEPVSTELAKRRDTKGRANEFGPLAVAVPGALAGWCLALDKYGTMPLAEAVAPAIRFAATGFRATSYLADCVADMASHLAHDPTYAATFLPGGAPLAAGTRVVRADMAASLRMIAEQGPAALYDGPLGQALVAYMAANGGLIARLRNRRPAAAVFGGRSCGADAQSARAIRYPKNGLRLGRCHASIG